jgi:hypothetical protein
MSIKAIEQILVMQQEIISHGKYTWTIERWKGSITRSELQPIMDEMMKTLSQEIQILEKCTGKTRIILTGDHSSYDDVIRVIEENVKHTDVSKQI